MTTFPKKLQAKLAFREENQTLRSLTDTANLIDFSSNDYLGYSRSESIFEKAHQLLLENDISRNGATGSRLLSGNHSLYTVTETNIANHHNAPTALIFNSGYDANIGVFSAVPQRGDIILYDQYIHASIRDGISMSLAKSYKFKHNDLEDLENKLKSFSRHDQEIYVVSESVFSMDGDRPDLLALTQLCNQKSARLIIDEAHAVGIFGTKGSGLVATLGLESAVFARIVTFGKALGCHGAAVLGSTNLKNYLINFARSFIYTTGLPPHSLATIQAVYQELINTSNPQERLQKNRVFFNQEIERLGLKHLFIASISAIHCAIIPGNTRVKSIALNFQKKGFDIKPILPPTVPKGEERIRFCLHSYNSFQEITDVLELLAIFVKKQKTS